MRECGKFSAEFELEMGLKQGSVFAPVLFNIFFGAIIKALRKRLVEREVMTLQLKVLMDNPFDTKLFVDRGMSQPWTVSDILFADDAAFISTSEEGLQKILDAADEILSAYGQTISIKKTEVMVVQPKLESGKVVSIADPQITLRGQTLGVTTSFKYVGSKVNNFADMSNEVDTRIKMMNAAFHRFRVNLMTNFSLPRRNRLKGFVAYCLTAALYGCETWNILDADIDRLESNQFRLLRRVLGYSWKDNKSFASLIDEGRRSGVDILPIGIMISRARFAFFGHMMRMGDERMPKRLFCAQLVLPKGATRAQGVEYSYKAAILKDLEAFGFFERKTTLQTGNDGETSWKRIMELTKDRVTWRTEVKTKGVEKSMNAWYTTKAAASNVRHKKSDGDKYVPREAFVFHHPLADLSTAIGSGAVSTGRGTQGHRRWRAEQVNQSAGRVAAVEPAARRMLKHLRGDP